MSRWKILFLFCLLIGVIGGLLGVFVIIGFLDEVFGILEGVFGVFVGNFGVCLLWYLVNIFFVLLGENFEIKGMVKYGYCLN